jgi:hypothetical protein
MKKPGLMNLGLALAMCLACSCSKKPKKDPLKVTKADVAKPAAVISQAAAEKFGADFEAALRAKNPNQLGKLLDMAGMYYRIFPKDVVDDNQQLKQARLGWEPTVRRSVQQVLVTFRVEFLRAVKDGDGMKARFRLSGQGVNYWDILLGRNIAGRVCMVDYLGYTEGEYFSETQRRLFQQLIPGLLRGTRSKALADAELRSIQKLKELTTFLREGQYESFLQSYDHLDPALQQQRTILYYRVMAANAIAAKDPNPGPVTMKIYSNAVDEYLREFPAASNLELMQLDYYFLTKDFRAVIRVVDQLDRRVGGDPYLDLLRGNALHAMNELAPAKAKLRAVEKSCPWEKDVYNALVAISLEEKDFIETTRLLMATEKNTEQEWEPNFNGAELFDAYRASKEFAKWQDYVRGRK